MPYHFSNTAVSFSRKSAARSMTFTPASSSSGVCAMATPCGVAKNTTSQCRQFRLFRRRKCQLHESAQRRKHVRYRHAVFLARRNCSQLHLRMRCQQTQ